MESVVHGTVRGRLLASIAAGALCVALGAGVTGAAAPAYADEAAAGDAISTQANGPAVDQVHSVYGQIILSHFDASDNTDDYKSYQEKDETGSTQVTIYNSYTMAAGLSVNGISYDKAKNTITLEKVNEPTGVLHIINMGEDLKIEVKDTNSLGKIDIDGSVWRSNANGEVFDNSYHPYGQGASLEMTGSGTLNLNKNKLELGTPLTVDGGSGEVVQYISEQEYEAAIEGYNDNQDVSYSIEYRRVTKDDGYGGTYNATERNGYIKITRTYYNSKLVVGKSVNLNIETDGKSTPITLSGTMLEKGSAFKFNGLVENPDVFITKTRNNQRIISSVDFTQAYTAKYGEAPGGGDTWYDAVSSHKDWEYDGLTKQWYRMSNSTGSLRYYSYSVAATSFSQTASQATVGNLTYTVKSATDKTAYVKKAANKKKVTVPKTVTINGKKFSVTGISKKAFKSAKKCKTVTVKATELTKKSVKNSLKGSKVTTVKVPKKQKDVYTLYFAKSNAGKSVTVK